MDKRVYVCYTMDCETIAERATRLSGVESWDLSERAMRGYVEYLYGRGQRVTLFLIPDLVEHQAQTVLDLGESGADLGSHYHPQYDDCGYDGYIGEFDWPMQMQMLGEGRDRFAQALGQLPTSFRPGNFSANDDTFPVLVELGYRQGSVSLPGRELPRLAACWRGAESFAHWASAGDRKRPGELCFLEAPCTAHLADLNQAQGPGDARHLRIESGGIRDWGRQVVSDNLDAQVEADHWLKSIVVMTHNIADYSAPQDPRRQTLEWLVDVIEEEVERRGLELVPATLEQVRAAALR